MDLFIVFSFLIDLIVFAASVIYLEKMHRQDMARKDEMIKDLELKFISKNVADYDSVRQEPPENMEREEEDPYVPVEDIPLEELQEAEDNI